MKKFVAELREKSGRAKLLMKQMDALHAEEAVLGRTDQLLAQQSAELAHRIEDFESAHGVSGFREAQTKLELVSESKGDVDEQNERLLQEYSTKVRTCVCAHE